MASASFTTSTTGIDLGPGVVNGIYISDSTASSRVNLYDAASTTGTASLTVQKGTAATGYISLGGLTFGTACTVGATAAYGGITLIRQ